jgi:hypothetical protein
VQNRTPQLYPGGRNFPKAETTLPFQAKSQNICLENSLRIVEIMDAYCTKFGMHAVSIFAAQPASIALTTLLENLSELDNSSKTATILQHVQTLINILQKLSPNYQTADNICTVVNHILPQIRIGAPSTTDFEVRDGACQSSPSQSPLQSTSQRSLEPTTHLEQWASFPGNGMNTDKDTVTVSHPGFPPSTSNTMSTQRNVDLVTSTNATTATSVSMTHHSGNTMMGKDDFLDLGNSCHISPFSISSYN